MDHCGFVFFQSREQRRNFAKCRLEMFAASWMLFGGNGTSFREAGEKAGAVNGIHPGSQRPEIPAAQGLFKLRAHCKHGADLGVSAPSTVPQMRNSLLFAQNKRC